jgi:hypothetical protein
MNRIHFSSKILVNLLKCLQILTIIAPKLKILLVLLVTVKCLRADYYEGMNQGLDRVDASTVFNRFLTDRPTRCS